MTEEFNSDAVESVFTTEPRQDLQRLGAYISGIFSALKKYYYYFILWFITGY